MKQRSSKHINTKNFSLIVVRELMETTSYWIKKRWLHVCDFKRTGGVAQVAKCLPTGCKALTVNPSTEIIKNIFFSFLSLLS
jgi:hypothetical protein